MKNDNRQGQAAIEKPSVSARSLHGQAAIDFLMTYGWAIILIILVAAALFALGIFNTGSYVGNKAAAFTEMQVVGFNVLQNGTLTVQIQNQYGKTIKDTLEMVLATPSGKWLGKGWFGNHTTTFPFRMNIRFPYIGTYTFTVKQAMRCPSKTLNGITNFGIKIKRR